MRGRGVQWLCPASLWAPGHLLVLPRDPPTPTAAAVRWQHLATGPGTQCSWAWSSPLITSNPGFFAVFVSLHLLGRSVMQVGFVAVQKRLEKGATGCRNLQLFRCRVFGGTAAEVPPPCPLLGGGARWAWFRGQVGQQWA